MKRRTPQAFPLAKAGEGIPLEDYIDVHEQPEPLVRAKLDRNELRYAWTEINGNKRASDDGGPLPLKGWWTRPIFTTIDRETHEVRGDARERPTFPPMYYVKVFPPATAANPAPEPKTRRRKRAGKKYNKVLEILADIDQGEGLPSDLTPAEIERKVLHKVPPDLRQRWGKVGPDGRLKPPISRKVINRAYQDYLKARSSK